MVQIFDDDTFSEETYHSSSITYFGQIRTPIKHLSQKFVADGSIPGEDSENPAIQLAILRARRILEFKSG